MAEAGYRARRARAVRDSVTNNWRETAGLGSGGAAALAATAGAGAPTSVVGTVAAVGAVTTVGKMARDAVRAVAQQPRESVSTLEDSIRIAGENPSRENIQGLGKLAGDVKRLGNAHGAVETANQAYTAKISTADKKRRMKMNSAERRFGRRSEKAASARDKKTRGVRGYLGR